MARAPGSQAISMPTVEQEQGVLSQEALLDLLQTPAPFSQQQLINLMQTPVLIPASSGHTHRRSSPNPPNASPLALFTPSLKYYAAPEVHRLIHIDDARQILIYCGGACVNNGPGYWSQRGGCGVIFGMLSDSHGNWLREDAIGFPLENDGNAHTSNRAELRSAIVGLSLRNWLGEGFERVVVGMDSQYVVEGLTEWIDFWIENNWRTFSGAPVANRDLWEALLATLRHLDQEGIHVKFWQISREVNMPAYICAIHAANVME